MARPSEFTKEVADEICERISNGESLRAICLDEHMPGKSTVFRWLAADQVFQDQYTRAREAQAETLADEMVDIADDGHNDWMEKNFGEDTRWVENGEAIRRSALRIDTRKWVAARLLPKKYGDKTQLEHTGKMEVTDTDSRQLSRAILAVLSEATLEEPEE